MQRADDDAWEEDARALDETWSRVACACQRVRDILDLKKCVAGVATSMRSGDYEEAARCIGRFRAVDGSTDVASSERMFMKRMDIDLKRTVVEKFDAAVVSYSVC